MFVRMDRELKEEKTFTL